MQLEPARQQVVGTFVLTLRPRNEGMMRWTTNTSSITDRSMLWPNTQHYRTEMNCVFFNRLPPTPYFIDFWRTKIAECVLECSWRQITLSGTGYCNDLPSRPVSQGLHLVWQLFEQAASMSLRSLPKLHGRRRLGSQYQFIALLRMALNPPTKRFAL